MPHGACQAASAWSVSQVLRPGEMAPPRASKLRGGSQQLPAVLFRSTTSDPKPQPTCPLWWALTLGAVEGGGYLPPSSLQSQAPGIRAALVPGAHGITHSPQPVHLLPSQGDHRKGLGDISSISLGLLLLPCVTPYGWCTPFLGHSSPHALACHL